MNDMKGREFSVKVNIAGEMQEVFILTSETTEGVTFYNCRINGNEITQIRNDEQTWKQVWGSVPEEDVQAIGEAIENATLEKE